MWEKLAHEWPEPIGKFTEAVYTLTHTDSGCVVGVMRPSLWAPPVLWLSYAKATMTDLRRVRKELDELQLMLNEPVVWAETSGETAGKFARFAGFEYKQTNLGRDLYERKVTCKQ